MTGWFGPALAFATGVVAWTLAEYLLHRFAMHELRGRGILSREHLRHHAGVLFELSKTISSWIGVVVVGGAIGAAAWIVAGPRLGLPWAAGWVVGYGVYDWLHGRAHSGRPRTGYGRWLRRHHFHHHFGHPLENHGVTSPVWDVVFGTRAVPGRVRVPRRLAMQWLLDDAGAVRPEYASDYFVVGRTVRDGEAAARDSADAFANRPPAD